MDSENVRILLETETDAPQPWHKPSMQRLTVSLDTRIGTGSTVDQDGSTAISV
jgi:hypothetical protein